MNIYWQVKIKKEDDDNPKFPTGGSTPEDAPSNSEFDNEGNKIIDAACGYTIFKLYEQ